MGHWQSDLEPNLTDHELEQQPDAIYSSIYRDIVVPTTVPAVICFRADDIFAEHYSAGLWAGFYGELKSRGMIGSHAAHLNGLDAAGRMTTANLLDSQANGMEVQLHSRTHLDIGNPAHFSGRDPWLTFLDEVVTAKTDLNLKGGLPDAFVQPGPWGTEGNAAWMLDSDAKIAGRVGRKFRTGFASLEAYVTGFGQGGTNANTGPFPMVRHFGQGHTYTLDTTTLALAKTAVDATVDRGGILEFMVHDLPNAASNGVNFGYNDFQALLDYVKGYIDAGLAINLGPTATRYARHGAAVTNIFPDPGFLRTAAGNTITSAGGYGGVQTGGSVVIAATDRAGSTGNMATIGSGGANTILFNPKAWNLRRMRLEFWAKRATAGVAANFQVRSKLMDTGATVMNDLTIQKSLTDNWAKYIFHFGNRVQTVPNVVDGTGVGQFDATSGFPLVGDRFNLTFQTTGNQAKIEAPIVYRV